MTSFLGAPVMVKGRSVGNLYLSDKLEGEPFSEDDERLVEMFAVHAGIAIENARLHDQVQRLAVVEERERIGKDLHDGIIQAIYAVGLSLEDVPELVEDEDGPPGCRRPRGPRDRRPQPRDRRHPLLHPAAAAGHRRAGGPGGGPCAPGRGARDARRHRPRGGPRGRRRAACARCRRTAGPTCCSSRARRSANVARHSGATRTALVLAQDEGDLVLCVEDNGRGFDPATVPGPDAFGRHQGLGNMRDRAIGMGGTFAVERPDGSGTRIIVRVPASSSAGSGASVLPPPPETTDRD